MRMVIAWAAVVVGSGACVYGVDLIGGDGAAWVMAGLIIALVGLFAVNVDRTGEPVERGDEWPVPADLTRRRSG